MHGPNSTSRSARWVAQRFGWGSAALDGAHRGLAVCKAAGSFVAGGAEVSVDDRGRLRIRRIVGASYPGHAVNPQQIQGSFVFGLSALLYGECVIERGRVEQENFDGRRWETSTCGPPDLALDAATGRQNSRFRACSSGFELPRSTCLAPPWPNSAAADSSRSLSRLPRSIMYPPVHLQESVLAPMIPRRRRKRHDMANPDRVQAPPDAWPVSRLAARCARRHGRRTS